MTRRLFSRKTAAVLAACGFGSIQTDADMIDLDKKSKKVAEEENRTTVTILGYDSQKVSDKGTLKDLRLWSCRYQLKRVDGSVTTRTTPDVMSTNQETPPMKFQFDLS